MLSAGHPLNERRARPRRSGGPRRTSGSATLPASILDDTERWSVLTPLGRLADVHARQLRVCDILERIADALPRPPSRLVCLRLLDILTVDMPLHHADEEGGLFPLLRRRTEADDGIDAVLERLSIEHTEDEALLPEVLETLQALADDVGPEREPDIAGYVLRGYFESQRRHIAWEEDVVMPLARNRLHATDIETLDTIMRANRTRVQEGLGRY